MSDAAYVTQAQVWARELVRAECRGRGDTLPAIRRVARRAGILSGTLWGLYFKRPKTCDVSVYFKLKSAYEALLEAQLRRAKHELQEAMAAGAAPYLVRAAAFALGEEV